MGVKIVETGLRDGHQSLFATRMNTEEVLCALKELDQVGYHAIEIWGGATFDACLRFLNEDPWERLRLAKKFVRKLNYKCYSVVKTSSVTDTMLTM